MGNLVKLAGDLRRPKTPQMLVNCKGIPRLFQGNIGEGEILQFGQMV